MQLWEKGLFSLDDKLSEYMPEFNEMSVRVEGGIKKAERPILIKHLFKMTAGFDYNARLQSIKEAQAATGGRCPTREVMKYLAKEPLCFEPGEHWNYSLCHDVLAALVEVVSGMRFSEYVKKNIFNPLGMNHSTFLLPDCELDTLASQYRFDAETKKTVNCGKNIQGYKFGTEYESGGAAGAYLSVDVENGLSVYYAQHMLSSPNQEIRSWVYRYVMAELFGKEEFKKLIRESVLSNEYRFTF